MRCVPSGKSTSQPTQSKTDTMEAPVIIEILIKFCVRNMQRIPSMSLRLCGVFLYPLLLADNIISGNDIIIKPKKNMQKLKLPKLCRTDIATINGQGRNLYLSKLGRDKWYCMAP